MVSSDKMSALLPHVVALGKDQLSIVRCKLFFYSAYVGSILKNMLQAISKDQCYQAILPLIKDLMKDDNQ